MVKYLKKNPYNENEIKKADSDIRVVLLYTQYILSQYYETQGIIKPLVVLTLTLTQNLKKPISHSRPDLKTHITNKNNAERRVAVDDDIPV